MDIAHTAHEHGAVLSAVANDLRCAYESSPSWSAHSRLLPDPKAVTEIFLELRSVIFPGYSDAGQGPAGCSDTPCLMERLGVLYWRLARQIHNTLTDTCYSNCGGDCDVMLRSRLLSGAFLEALPGIRQALLLDVQAAYDGDPAAKGYDEILLAYPGVYAITAHRVAHVLFGHGLTIIARMLSEHAHSTTGIDIHPGATIGRSFFIDHGTGVVIGETTVIGADVKLYQGVTLGALSFPTDSNGNLIRDAKRHPTIEDGVTVYAGATILGGDTVVGKGSVIGGNVWLTESVPPYSKVLNKPAIDLQRRRSAGRNVTPAEPTSAAPTA